MNRSRYWSFLSAESHCNNAVIHLYCCWYSVPLVRIGTNTFTFCRTCHILFYPYIGQLCLLFTCRPLRRLNIRSPVLNKESFYKSNGPNVELSYNKCSADLKSIKLFTIFAFNYNLLDKRKDLIAAPESTNNWWPSRRWHSFLGDNV